MEAKLCCNWTARIRVSKKGSRTDQSVPQEEKYGRPCVFSFLQYTSNFSKIPDLFWNECQYWHEVLAKISKKCTGMHGRRFADSQNQIVSQCDLLLKLNYIRPSIPWTLNSSETGPIRAICLTSAQGIECPRYSTPRIGAFATWILRVYDKSSPAKSTCASKRTKIQKHVSLLLTSTFYTSDRSKVKISRILL